MAKSNIKIKIEEVDISKIKPNPNNPRIIKDEKFNKLVQSIKSFPDMLRIRPIVVNENNEVLGGNMRLKALHHLKYDRVPVIRANKLTEAQKKEFIIKDNVGFGDWDWDMLANIIACEKTGRKCYGMEIDPKYCQVTIDRVLRHDPSLKVKKNGKPFNKIERKSHSSLV